MRARTIVLIILVGVVLVGASASVWIPSASRRLSLIRRPVEQEGRLANTPAIKREGPLPQGYKPVGLLLPTDLTKEQADYIRAACMERQTCATSLAGEVKMVAGILKDWKKEETELQQENNELRFALTIQTNAMNEGTGQREQLEELRDRIAQDEHDRKSEEFDRERRERVKKWCEEVNALNHAWDIDEGCR